MKVTDVAISLRTATVVLTLIATFGGMAAYVTLPKEANPSIEIPRLVITTLYPGASPSDVENLITQRIEQEIQSINGIDNIRSSSVEGVSTISVEFTPDVSIDEANQKIRDQVDIAKPDLPTEVEEPIISEIDLSEFPIMTVNLVADYSLARLKEVAEDLEDELETIPGILEIDVFGGLEREVQVEVDLAKLQGYNLSFQDIANTIRTENTNIPGGSVDVDRLNYLVRVDGQFKHPRQIEDLLVEARDGRPIYIRDVARVVFGFKDRESYARLLVLRRELPNGEWQDEKERAFTPVISLNIKKRSGENILAAVDAVQETLDAFPFPPGTNVVVTGDQSKDVRTLVSDLENNIISGLIFVVSVLLFFLGVRTAVLVGIAIPLSMFISFIVFQMMGQTLNFIILFSLIIALGMLVDNAIVIVENIYRYLEEGHSHWEAAQKGTAEVGMAVVASTATTVAVFFPMLSWPGIIGEFMSFMPLTLIVTLSSSLFVALVINPVITGYFARVQGEDPGVQSPASRVLWLVVAAGAAATLGLANPITLGVLSVSIAVIYVIHRFVLSRAANWFIEKGLPGLVEYYRGFLEAMLERDYSHRYAMARNATGLSCLSAGFVLLIIGGIVYASLGAPPITFGFTAKDRASWAALVTLLPGLLLLLIGILGVVIHTIETLLWLGMSAVRFGVGLAAVVSVFLIILIISQGIIEPAVVKGSFAIPVFVVVLGLLGSLILRSDRNLILTDNRARLMNSVLGSLVGIMVIYQLAPTGSVFFPATDPNQILVRVEGRLGTNLEASNLMAHETQALFESLMRESADSEGNFKNAQINVGVGGDVIFGGGSRSPERTQMTVNMIDYKDRVESSKDTLLRVRDKFRGIAGADITIDKDQQGPPTGPPVNIEISGPEFEEIVRISTIIKNRLKTLSDSGEIEGLIDIRDNLNSGRPELQVQVDRERAARFGLSTIEVASTVRTAIAGEEVSKFRDGEDEYDIRVRLLKADRESLDSLRNLTIVQDGTQIPIMAVADLEVTGGLGSITRLDLRRVVTVQGDVSEGVQSSEVLLKVRKELKEIEAQLPPGYAMRYTGENKDQEESNAFLSQVLATGLALICLILIAQFNSIIGPLIIMIAVGLSLIGVYLGLFLTRIPSSLMTFIGIISLAGIVVNNNIVLIDYTQQLRDRGLPKKRAIVEAGATRLRPVLLTALTTVLGLIPLVFGLNIDFVGLFRELDPAFQLGSQNTQFWGPMGTAIISGLTFATFLTLVIIPVMYSLFDSVQERVKGLLTRRPRV